MVLRELGKFHVAVGLIQGHGILLVIDVGEPLEEQQREDVGLEIGRVDRTAENIRSFPKMPGKGRNIQIGCITCTISVLSTHSV